MYKPNRVLFLAAHPDDELGTAGALHKFNRQGSKVSYAVFSNCIEDSWELGLNPSILIREMNEVLDILRISINDRYRMYYKARNFPQHRQSICDEMFNLNKTLNPDLVIVPNTKDVHQDHCVIRDEARRAFRHCSIFGYESVRAPLGPDNLCFVQLESVDFIVKEEAMKCYETQGSRIDVELRAYLSRVRGSQVGYKRAEVFEVIRLCS